MGKLIYLLDTNILAELASADSSSFTAKRFRLNELRCALASPVVHEIAYGVERMPRGNKQTLLKAFLAALLESGPEVLPYDTDAAIWHARERARLEARGRTPPYRDGEIAAVAATNGLILVTRNTADFKLFHGLKLENWIKG